MKAKRYALTGALGIGLGLLATVNPADAAFTQCPAIGASASCAVLFTFTPGGGVNTSIDSAIGPYDSADDVLVGVQNNSGQAVYSLNLVGHGNGGGIFAFEYDGLQTYLPSSTTSSWQYPSGYSVTGYEGPNTWFSNIGNSGSGYSSDKGTVNFLQGLEAGSSAYFSLESSPNGIQITPSNPGAAVPEPGSLGMLALGLGMLGFGLRRQRKVPTLAA